MLQNFVITPSKQNEYYLHIMPINSKSPATPSHKRDKTVCVQCSKRKVKCDKSIPCRNCIRRKEAHLCRLPSNSTSSISINASSPSSSSPVYQNTRSIRQFDSSDERHSVKTLINHNTTPKSQLKAYGTLPFRVAPLEVYYKSLRSLTYGVTKMENLKTGTVSQNLCSDYDSSINRFQMLLPKLDHQSSNLLCDFACTYTTFLHHGVIKSMFMADHESFFSNEVLTYPNSLNYLLDCPLKLSSPRDYYYWMSLYYSMLALGCSFGSDELKQYLPYSNEELTLFPQVFLQASLDAVMRAEALQKPDIRFIQIYCVMTTFLHALGKAQLHKQLLNAAVEVARWLRLDCVGSQEFSSIDFQKEIMKRLWYSIYIVDSFSNYPRRLINHHTTSLPQLINDHQLQKEKELHQAPSIDQILSDDDLSGLMYQKFMVEIGNLKQESHQKCHTLEDVSHSWNETNQLKQRLEAFFDPSQVKPGSISSFARYLLFSSLTRETLDIGSRLQTLMDFGDWCTHYRDSCISLAMGLLTHSAQENLPTCYNKYWIVAQHLIYACLFILLDMLMLKSDQDNIKFNKVKNALSTLRKLKSSHFTANVGVAVIDKLCRLVSLVRLDNWNSGSVENISLQNFLRELEIANPSVNPRSSKSTQRICPPVNHSQYYRKDSKLIGVDQVVLSPDSITVSSSKSQNGSVSTPIHFLDPSVSKILDDTGWCQFLNFFFGSEDHDDFRID